jgi:hypothetical protein
MSTLAINVPRFNLPSSADPNGCLPTMTHRASDVTVEDSRASCRAWRRNWLRCTGGGRGPHEVQHHPHSAAEPLKAPLEKRFA